jgi:hypothetical protein
MLHGLLRHALRVSEGDKTLGLDMLKPACAAAAAVAAGAGAAAVAAAGAVAAAAAGWLQGCYREF